MLNQITITPDQAKKLLLNNETNRPQTLSVIKEYAKDMREGKWELNGETIKLNADGGLLDGQHRLEACILADRAFDTFIVQVESDNAFDTIDIGKKRTGADTFHVQGEKNAALLASVMRLVVEYEKMGKVSATSFKVTSRTLRESLGRHPTVRQSVSYAGSRRVNFTNGTVIGFCHYVFSKIDDTAALVFMDQLCLAEGLVKTDAAYILKEKLIAEKLAASKYQVRNSYSVALIFKAWNAFRSGSPIKVLRLHPDEDFPIPK